MNLHTIGFVIHQPDDRIRPLFTVSHLMKFFRRSGFEDHTVFKISGAIGYDGIISRLPALTELIARNEKHPGKSPRIFIDIDLASVNESEVFNFQVF